MLHVNEAKLRSFIETPADSDFPVQNLPWGVFRRAAAGPARVGVRIGDFVVDLVELSAAGLLPQLRDAAVLETGSLNAFARLGRGVWTAVRGRVSELLRHDNPTLRDDAKLRARALIPLGDVIPALPFAIPAFTDFYSSEHHGTNVGRLFRDKNNALLPNWKHLPVAYNGRASTVVVSGVPVIRPSGQLKPTPDEAPIFAPARRLDFELEIGFYLGKGNEHGVPIHVDEARDHIFGLCLLNDWSARDHQAWEYQPLGPFLSKSFATTVSPWVVALEALEPFQIGMPAQDPAPLPYLAERDRRTYDIRLAVDLKTAKMSKPETICQTSLAEVYWSMSQQLAHHTCNGCAMSVGDLLGTGTISGPDQSSWGSLLEMTFNGREPLTLSTGEKRAFLEDGDEVTLRGYCQGDGYRVGLGQATGVVVPARGR